MIIAITVSCKKDETTKKKDPVITWANPADISFGTVLSATQLNATADVAGTFVYTPAIGTTLTIGLNQDLKVDFKPADASNYNPASKTVKINVVAKKDPVITWTNPADISFGTLLSATQLNATADVSGIFVYTPAAGTQLNEGANQNLKVDFTPTNIVEYNTISKTVTINVTAPVPVTVTDTSGNVYPTITLGTQTWMAENLKTTKYNDGTDIPLVTENNEWFNLTTAAYCWYNNDETAFKETYGALYNGYAVNTKLCPSGWHIPSNSDWEDLELFLQDHGYNYDGTTTGNKYAKALATATGWTFHTGTGTVGNTDYPEKRNATGFSGYPAGYRINWGTSYHSGDQTFWWSSNEASSEAIYYLSITNNYASAAIYYSAKSTGFSVRCLKD
ncbi:MAG: fibrobacter succinogenes major paralogous domain-containing protein [Bacteroidales bacterium]|nr:fibrobacter succinogenes major paralogous domain-containing protein [Bacteroidales bacterium]